MDVFVSYATPDRHLVAPMVEALESEGWSVWWDRDIQAGKAFDREIQTALDDARCVVVVWTQSSVESDWVLAEATEGLERGVLIPVVLDGVRPPLAFRRIQAVERENLIGAITRQVQGAKTLPRKHVLTGLFEERSPSDGSVSRIRRIAGTFRGQAGEAADGCIAVTFPSAVAAVRAGLEIRRTLEAELRIGIQAESGSEHVDVPQQAGISLARLAAPGGIALSDAVFQQVRRRLELAPEDLGERVLDGEPKPVHVYLVGQQSAPRITIRAEMQPVEVPEAIPSLAVLPFKNMNASADFEYFGDGLAMDIVEELLRIPRMQVVSTMSTLTYKKSSAAARDIGAELGVAHVLEGSVRQVGGQMRITAQLVDTRNGQVEWADHYDRGVEDVFSVQDEITRHITTAMDVKFYGGEGAKVTHQLIRTAEARQYFYKAWELTNRLNKADSAQARFYLEEAIRLEPESPLTYSMLAWVHYLEKERGWTDSESATLEKIVRLVDEAMKRNDLSGIGPMLTGYLSLLEDHHEDALKASQEAIEKRPSCPVAFSMRAGILNYSGKSEDAVAPAKQAVRLSPVVQPVYPEMLALAYYLNRRHGEALESANQTLSYAPDSVDARVVLAASLVESGRQEIATEIGAEILSLDPGFGLSRYESTHPFRDRSTLQRITGSLREAGLAEHRDASRRHGLAPESRRRVMPQRKR